MERRIRWPGARMIRSGAPAGAGEMEQSVKCPVKYVLHKANDLSSDPQDPCKRLSNTAFACNSSTSNVLWECGGSNGSRSIPEAHYSPQSAWSNG